MGQKGRLAALRASLLEGCLGTGFCVPHKLLKLLSCPLLTSLSQRLTPCHGLGDLLLHLTVSLICYVL